ncbi:MAG: alpha/beta hydrolase [Clostridiales bacterium]|nr:alpha/beta hydrolase [Clostridiales bacterium]
MNESADDLSLYFETMGTGAPVVLLHGWGQTHRVFDELARQLSKHYFVILPDSRAHGKSDYGKCRLCIRLMAEDTVCLLDRIGVPCAAVIGFSDGGNIALEMAVSHPERLHCVITLSANAWPDGTVPFLLIPVQIAYRVLRLLHGISFLQRGSERLALLLDSDRATASQLAGIRLPVMIVGGDFDMIRMEHTRFLAKIIPGARLLLLRHATHFSSLRRWKEWLPAACDLIDGK